MAAEVATLEPQFADLQQQAEASVLGMWVFLATEVLLFGGFITAFLALRSFYAHDFEIASARLNVLIGGINTLVLLASSLTMALAVHAAGAGDRGGIRWLVLTAFLGTAFLGLKGFEFYVDWRDGLVPMTGRFAAEDWTAADRDHFVVFMLFYFVLTGLHAVHLLIGIGLVSWIAMLTASRRRPCCPAVLTEVIGLYWHFVDVVWIFLLPLLYLSGHHGPGDLHF